MPKIIISDGPSKKKYRIGEETVKIGRSGDNNVVLKDTKASRNHAEIRFEDGRFFVVDLESRNGTRVNGEQIRSHGLRHNDQVQIGQAVITFLDESQAQMSEGDFDALPAGEGGGTGAPGPTAMPTGYDLEFKHASHYLLVLSEREKGMRYPVRQDQINTIGRNRQNFIMIMDNKISGQHAQVYFRDGNFYVKDLESANGTRVNGERINTETTIRHGDTVKFATTRCLFVDKEKPEPEAEELVGAVGNTMSIDPSEFDRVEMEGGDLWPILLTILFVGLLGAAGWFGWEYYRNIRPPAEPIAGNRIGNFSFEERNQQGMPGDWDVYAGNVLLVEDAYRGKFGLRMHSPDQTPGLARVQYAKPIKVEGGARYEAGARIRTGGTGTAFAFMMEYIGGGRSEVEYSPFFFGKCDWREHKSVFAVPEWAGEVSWGIVATYGYTDVAVDDVYFLKTEKPAAVLDPKVFTIGEYKLIVTDNGEIEMRYSPPDGGDAQEKRIFWNGWIGFGGRRDRPLCAVESVVPSATGEKIHLLGKILDPDVVLWQEFVIGMEKTDPLTVRFSAQVKNALRPIKLELISDEQALADSLRVKTETAEDVRRVQIEWHEEEVQRVTFLNPPHQIIQSFGRSPGLSLEREKERIILSFLSKEILPGEGSRISFGLTTRQSISDKAEEYYRDARKARNDLRVTQAIENYKLAEKEAIRANKVALSNKVRDERKAFEKEADGLYEKIFRRAEQIVGDPNATAEDVTMIYRLLDDYVRRFEGMHYEEKLAVLLERVKQKGETDQRKKNEKAAQEIFGRGLRFEQSQELHLALYFYRRVLIKYPGTTVAEEAGQKVRKLEDLIKRDA